MSSFWSHDLCSSHWFTSQPLERHTLESMLTRILAVREVLTEASTRPPSASGESPGTPAPSSCVTAAQRSPSVIQWELNRDVFVSTPDNFSNFLVLWTVLAERRLHHGASAEIRDLCRMWQVDSPQTSGWMWGQMRSDVRQSELFLSVPSLNRCNLTQKVFIIISHRFRGCFKGLNCHQQIKDAKYDQILYLYLQYQSQFQTYLLIFFP